MDKSCQLSGESNSFSNRDPNNSLNLSKISHKISKTTSFRKPNFENQNQSFNHTQNQLLSGSPAQQNQPPVYNINKNDFRDVVQKLTGSPVHDRFSNPAPPLPPPKPQNSRLQRIRPPPLAHVSNFPPPQQLNNFISGNLRPVAPLSPLPPFPTVHVAAESPVSAYLRYFNYSVSGGDSNSQFQIPYSPSLIFSTALGFPQLPLSPSVAASSPRWSAD